ncbi:MAG: CBS domain-containing protein [Saprospirales bacterium]|nr:MAG: CBS domain-containing protein [Saprospirales bacterium]
MNMDQKVSEIMSTNVHSVKLTDNLHRAIRLIRKHKIRHLPVVDGKQIAGIISSTDLNRLTFGGIFDNQDSSDEAILEMLSIPQVMTSKPRTVNVNNTVTEVAEIFVKEGFHAMPVVENDVLAGIVTTTDVIKFMLGKK